MLKLFWRITQKTHVMAFTGMLVTFVVAPLFAIFGMQIHYALVIGIVSGFIAGFFALREFIQITKMI